MAYIEDDTPVIALSTAADILKIKPRTLRMYEEKKLLPSNNGGVKKLYSLNDLKFIGFIHYLAGYKRVNASGIKFIIEECLPKLSKEEKEKLYKDAQTVIEGKEEDSDIEPDKFY